MCHGKPTVWRHTPNLSRFFGLDEPWDVKLAQHLGYHRPLRERNLQQAFLEFPLARTLLPEEQN